MKDLTPSSEAVKDPTPASVPSSGAEEDLALAWAPSSGAGKDPTLSSEAEEDAEIEEEEKTGSAIPESKSASKWAETLEPSCVDTRNVSFFCVSARHHC